MKPARIFGMALTANTRRTSYSSTRWCPTTAKNSSASTPTTATGQKMQSRATMKLPQQPTQELDAAPAAKPTEDPKEQTETRQQESGRIEHRVLAQTRRVWKKFRPPACGLATVLRVGRSAGGGEVGLCRGGRWL